MVNVGDIVLRRTMAMVDEQAHKDKTLRKGCVVYIHPKKRWYMVEFKTRSGKTYRECYMGVD